ncbi:hypothetical protein C3L33_01226, partial [Rhododendron williamsianum]
MEWATLQHLDLRHAGRSSKPLQPHAAAFHPSQALVAAAVGNHIIELDAYTGCKITSIDIGSPVVQMSYSPIGGHTVIAILEGFAGGSGGVVGTVEGGRAPTKIKTDLKKPIVNLACHPRLPLLYVAYADGLIRAYNIHTYAVHYTLQLDNTIKLLGAGAFAFHPTLEWILLEIAGYTSGMGCLH